MKHRILAIVLALCLLLSSAAMAQVEVNAPGTFPIVNEPVTLTVGIASNASVTDWETNAQTDHIEEITGVDLEFVEYASDEFVTKVNLMVASGGVDMPDVLIGTVSSKSTLVSWGDTGEIIPLNDYYANMAYYLKDGVDNGCDVDWDTFVKYMTCYDGNIYGLPTYSESFNNQISPNRLLIYQPWLDALGIDRYSIVTTEDLYNVLVRFRDDDPNGNGEKDEIPLIASTNTLEQIRLALSNPFIYTQRDYLIAEDGVVDVVFDRDEFREALKYVNKLVEEGLLMPESFTQDQKQMTAIQTQETHVVGAVGRVSTSNIPTSDEDYVLYNHIITLEGPEGVRAISRVPSIPSAAYFITANCENPDVAWLVGDYMSSQDMTIWGRLGRKGIEWDDPQEGQISPYAPFGKETVVAKSTVSWADVDNFYWANSGPRIYGARIFFGQAETAEGAMRDYNFLIAADIMKAGEFINDENGVVGLTYNEEESEVYDTVYTPILEYVNECWSRFALGDLDIDDDAQWSSFVTEVESMDLDVAIQSIQAAYDRQYK